MKQTAQEPLAIGKAALARSLNRAFFWQHGKAISLSFLTLIVLCFSLFQLIKNFSKGRSSSFIELDQFFNDWNANPSKETFQPLEAYLTRHPECESKFAGLIAQKLLALGETKKASYYAGLSSKRPGFLISPYYARFSQNSFLISQGKFNEAIADAKQLKQDLEKDEQFWHNKKDSAGYGTLLYAYNLMRIAALERELGSKEGELKALEEIANNAGFGESLQTKTYDPKAYMILEKNFTQNSLNLRSYIEYRKKALTS